MWREHADREHATYLRIYTELKKKKKKKGGGVGGGGGERERERKKEEIYHPPSLESMRAMIWT